MYLDAVFGGSVYNFLQVLDGRGRWVGGGIGDGNAHGLEEVVETGWVDGDQHSGRPGCGVAKRVQSPLRDEDE